MNDWFKSTPESERLLDQERLLISAAELIAEAIERRGISRTELAAELGVSKSEISQRLSGKRNLSIRSLADMMHVLGFGIEARLVDKRAPSVSVKVGHQSAAGFSQNPYRHHEPRNLRVIKGAAA